MSSAEEDQKRGGEFARLERQAERERARVEAQRVMDMCSSRSAMQIFEAVGGDVSNRTSANNPNISLAAVRMAGSGDDAERRRSSATGADSHNSILGRAANKNALNSPLDVVAKMDSMAKLRLEENQFSGTISSSFGSLKDLEVLVLSNNNISGELPSELGQLSKLNSLMAPNTNIDGIVPEEVCSLTKDYALAEFVMLH